MKVHIKYHSKLDNSKSDIIIDGIDTKQLTIVIKALSNTNVIDTLEEISETFTRPRYHAVKFLSEYDHPFIRTDNYHTAKNWLGEASGYIKENNKLIYYK